MSSYNFIKMKFYILIVLLFLNTSLFSQNNENQWIITAGYNAIDLYPTGIKKNIPFYPQGKVYEDFFNISNHWNFGGPSVSISKLITRSFYFGVEMSLNKIKKIEDQDNIDYPYYSGEVFLKKTFNSRKKLRPFIKSGFGISGIDRGLFGDSIPFNQYFSKTLSPSFGVQFRLTDHIGFEISSSFNKAIDKKGITHLRHNASIYLGIGNSDKDDDGIINRKDKCPRIKGVIEFNGCPDSDIDGIPDHEDKCPDVYGDKTNNGCPKENKLSDQDGIIIDKNQEIKTKIDDPLVSKNTSNTLENLKDKISEGFSNKNTKTLKPHDDMLIYFPAGGTRILGEKTFKKIRSVGNLLLSQKDLKILLEGRSSIEGGSILNLKLSNQRANVVKKFLIGLGIEPNRISVKALGEEEPIFDNNLIEGRVLNRSVFIIIY